MELSFDGKGINGPDEYKTRIATFSNAEMAEQFGDVFAASMELLDFAKLYKSGRGTPEMLNRLSDSAIAKAEGR